MIQNFDLPVCATISINYPLGIFPSGVYTKEIVLARYDGSNWKRVKTKKIKPCEWAEYIVVDFKKAVKLNDYLIVRTTNVLGSVISENVYQFKSTEGSSVAYILV